MRIPLKKPRPAADFPAPRDDPLLYPGQRPADSFLLAEGTVWPLSFVADAVGSAASLIHATFPSEGDGDARRIDRFLAAKGLAPLAERFAVIGYGSNTVPGQLVSKFGPDAVVPVVFGTIPGSDIVYNLISDQGYAFAEISLNVNGTEGRVGVTFLDEAQLKVMRTTEQNYRLAYCPAEVKLASGDLLTGGPSGNGYLFAGFRKVWVPPGLASPIPVAELPAAGRTRSALTQVETLQLAIESFGLHTRGNSTPRALVESVRRDADREEQPGKLKYDLQKAVDEDPRSMPPLTASVTLVPEHDFPSATFRHGRTE